MFSMFKTTDPFVSSECPENLETEENTVIIIFSDHPLLSIERYLTLKDFWKLKNNMLIMLFENVTKCCLEISIPCFLNSIPLLFTAPTTMAGA